MRSIDYPPELRNLMTQLRRLPSVGPRSAERMALWLLRSRQTPAADLAECLLVAASGLTLCAECGFFASTAEGCGICQDAGRDRSLLCVVEQNTDILPLERTGAFRGLYHALHGRISPLDNIGPDELRIAPLLLRARHGEVGEVILATGSDVEGEATAHYLTAQLRDAAPEVKVTRLAQGLPAGGGLDSADELTLLRALRGRRTAE